MFSTVNNPAVLELEDDATAKVQVLAIPLRAVFGAAAPYDPFDAHVRRFRIHNKLQTPVFEVKSKLTANTLREAWVNCASVKDLRKTAYVEPREGGLVKTWHCHGCEYKTPPPVHYFVFAFDSIDLMRVCEHFVAHVDKHSLDVTHRVDSVCVLNRCVISNKVGQAQYDALSEPGSALNATLTKRTLLLFYLFYTLTVLHSHCAVCIPVRYACISVPGLSRRRRRHDFWTRRRMTFNGSPGNKSGNKPP